MATRSSQLRILAIAKQNEIIIVYVSQMIARSFRSVLIQVREGWKREPKFQVPPGRCFWGFWQLFSGFKKRSVFCLILCWIWAPFWGPKININQHKTWSKNHYFWDPSGEGPGMVFGGFWAPNSEGLGGQKSVSNRFGNRDGDLQKTKENPMVF